MSDGPPDGARPPARGPDFELLFETIADAGADGFVAVGRDGADLRYLTGAATDRERALVVAGGGAALSLPPAAPFRDDGAPPAVDATAERRDGDASVGRHAVSLLAELAGEGGDGEPGGTVLVPRDLPHDAAVHLERAGYELASTRAVAGARASKSGAERDRLRDAQGVAAAGVGRAARRLDGSRDAAPVEVPGVEREVAAALAAAGAADVSRTRVVAGGPRDDGATAPVVCSLTPRLPDGYYARLVRTLVVGGDGGWERRAHVAVTSALRVAAAELEPGADAGAVRREATAELGSFGFGPSGAGDDARTEAEGGTTVDVHGVGVEPRESPRPEYGGSVPDGAVVAVDVRVADGERGTVRLADLFAVDGAGTAALGDVPRSLDPGAYFDPGTTDPDGSGTVDPGSLDDGAGRDG